MFVQLKVESHAMSALWVARALCLVTTANLVPWAVGRALGRRFAAPIDFGLLLKRGRRMLGSHKTWRGAIAAVCACAAVAALMQLNWWLGAAFGALAMAGDCLSSAWKRLRGHPPGSELFGLDQVPEALLPLAVLRTSLSLDWIEVALVVVLFSSLDIASTALRHPRVPRGA
jgi:hypothetical protein